MERSRNTRRSERQMAYKKRKRLRNRLLLFVGMAALVMIIVWIRRMNAQIEEMQVMLKQLESSQYRTQESGAEAEKIETDIGCVSSVEQISVEKPKDRTLVETLQKLEELGQTNPTIAKISENSSFYPENMLKALANNPEMADFVSGYLSERGEVTCEMTRSEKEQEYPLFLQWDMRWGYLPYGDDSNIGLSGCGPTCISMVLYYLTKNEMFTPDKIAAYAMDHNYYVEGTGTAWSLMKDVASLYGITVTEPSESEIALKAELDQGHVLICAMRQGDFTVAGHFIVIYGYDESGFMVNDPNCAARSRKRWPYHEIKEQIKKVWAYGNM